MILSGGVGLAGFTVGAERQGAAEDLLVELKGLPGVAGEHQVRVET